jgi:hypothetical protein
MFKAFISFILFTSISLFISANETSQALTDAPLITAFTAKYTILHKSDPVGKAVRKLSYLENGLIKYSYSTQIKWFIYSDKRTETSIVQLENKTDSKLNSTLVRPNHYIFDRQSTTRDRSYEWLYDVKNSQATNVKKSKTIDIDFSNGLQDPLSYHLQHRFNLIAANKINSLNNTFSYQVIKTSGSTKKYTYQYDGEEELMLPYGLIKTVKFKREVPNKKKITYAWFAPELDFLLVKLYQVKGGTEQFEAQLTSVTAD